MANDSRTIRLTGELQRSTAVEAIQSLPLDKGPWEVVIRKAKTKRSNDQNSLHWKRLDIIRLHVADSTGQFYSAEELHEYFKKKFLPVRFIDIDGEQVKVSRTSTKLTTSEFSEFMDHIDRYCIEHLNLYLPTPQMIGY